MAATTTVKLNDFTDFNPEQLAYGNVKTDTTYNFKRVWVNDGNRRYKTPVGMVIFPKKEDRNEGWTFSFCLSIDDDRFVDCFGNQLDNKLIKDGAENSVSWFGSDQDEEVCEDTYNSAISPPGGEYNRHIKNLRISNWDVDENQRIKFYDENSTPIELPDPSELLKMGTRVIVGFSISNLTIKDGKYRPVFKIHCVKIISRGENQDKSLTISDFDINKLSLKTPPTVMDNGGKKTYAKYTGGRLKFRLENCRFAPFSFKYVSEDSDKVSYSANLSLDDQEYQDLFKSIDTHFKNELVTHSKDFYGKKKSLKLVENGYKPICCYSKNDQEEMKKGNEPKYAPSIKVNFPFYEGQFKLTVEQDGSPFSGDFEAEFTNAEGKVNSSRRYSLDISCKHIWFGSKCTVKWECNYINMSASKGNSNEIYRFNDNDDEEEEEQSSQDEVAQVDSSDDEA